MSPSSLQGNIGSSKKQRIIELQIERLVWRGQGLARDTDGRLIMVSPEVLPNERVRAVVSKEQKKLLFAEPVTILIPSPFRREHPCPHFFEGCGGCRFGFIDSSNGLIFKKSMLQDALKRNLNVTDLPEIEIEPNPSPWAYRYRVQLHIKQKKTHFSMARSHKLIPVSACALLTPALDQQLPELGKQLDEGRHCVAASPVTNEIGTEHENQLLDFSLPDFGLFWQQPATCFFQANWKLNPLLVQKVIAYMTGQERIIDLFCGSGNFALPLARQGSMVFALEGASLSVKMGKNAAKKNGLSRQCRFQQANILHSSSWAQVQKFHPQAAVLDPPRTGAPGIAYSLIKLPNLTRIAWVSCDAVTTCRDLKLLLQHGWNITAIHLFDMFTQTWHMEVLFILEKKTFCRRKKL